MPRFALQEVRVGAGLRLDGDWGWPQSPLVLLRSSLGDPEPCAVFTNWCLDTVLGDKEATSAQ